MNAIPEWVWSVIAAATAIVATLSAGAARGRQLERRLTSLEAYGGREIHAKVLALEAEMAMVLKYATFAAGQVAAGVLHREDDDHGLDRFIDRWRRGEPLERDELVEFVRRLQGVLASSSASETERAAAEVFLMLLARRYGAASVEV